MSKPRSTGDTRCPSCGQQVAHAALKRHRGSAKCLEQRAKRYAQDTFASQPGLGVLYHAELKLLGRIYKELGRNPEDMEMQPDIVLLPEGDKPVIVYTAPAWLCVAAKAAVRLGNKADRNQYQIANHRRRQEHADANRCELAAQRYKVKHTQIVSDITELLRLGVSQEEATGMAVLMKLGGADPLRDVYMGYDDATVLDMIYECVRSTASRLLGGKG